MKEIEKILEECRSKVIKKISKDQKIVETENNDNFINAIKKSMIQFLKIFDMLEEEYTSKVV